MQWYYIQNGQRIGPVEESALFRLAREGNLAPEDLVWNPTLGQQWVPADSIPDLFPVPTATPPLPAGNTPNRLLMGRARTSLQGQWALAVGITLLYQVIVSGVQLVPYLGLIFLLLVFGPLMLGWNRIFLSLARRKSPDVGQLFDGFKLYGKTLAAYALLVLFISLWSLLLLIPALIAGVALPILGQSPESTGFIVALLIPFFVLMTLPVIRASLAYSQLFFILSDQPEISAYEALTLSKQLMAGYKWKKFCLGCRFIGWAILAIFTCGIGVLWLTPYIMTSNAHFYEDIRGGI